MIQINLEPLDTLFFRGSQSFTAGEETIANFNFPSPLTFFGAIGNAVIENMSVANRIKFMKGEYEHPKLGKYEDELSNTPMRIKGPFLYHENNVYFPSPANLWVGGTGNFHAVWTLRPYEKKKWEWDVGSETLRPLKIPKIKGLEIEPLNEFISNKDLMKYLSGKLKLLASKSEDEFFLKEIRYGNAISKSSKTPEESYLYASAHLRFKDQLEGCNYVKNGFTIIVEGLEESDLPNKVISLGGERRKVVVKCKKTKLIFEQPNVLSEIQNTKRFFVYFATPVIFKKGWLIELPLEFNDAVLVGAAVNKPQYVSGWKNNHNDFGGKPRPIKKVVPSGSVYFFEANSWNDEKFKKFYNKYHFGDSLSDEYKTAGFGIGLIGCW